LRPILFAALLFPFAAFGQHSQDLTVSWGGLGLRGDVGPTWGTPTQGQVWTLGYRYQGHPHYALRIVGEQGDFLASDAAIEPRGPQRPRHYRAHPDPKRLGARAK